MAITVNLDPVETAHDELAEALTALRTLGNTPIKSGDGWMARCPTHQDGKRSLSLTEGRDGRLVLYCHAGCDYATVKAKLGIPDRRPPGSESRVTVSAPPKRIVATYTYTDANGEELYEVIRYHPKDFRPRVNGRTGSGVMEGVPRVLYRLGRVLDQCRTGGHVYLCEGEKDVEALEDAGVVATCTAGGSSSWRDHFADSLKGASVVVIIADRDAPGIKYAQAAATSLLERDIPHVIRQARTGKDAHDHLAAGHNLDELIDYEPSEVGSLAEDPTEPAQQLDLPWTPLDLVTLGDTPRIPPELGGLIYTRRRHILSGESESGKSWLAFCIAATELQASHGVVWVDLDYMGAQDILERLRQLGCTDQQIRDRFAFYQPEGKLEGDSLTAVTELIEQTRARLVVIDAFTGFCALHGLKPNEGIDIEHAYRLMQPLCDTGAAIIILDHVVKDAGNRGRYAAGSERKLSGADVALGFTLIDHYGRGRTGRSRLTVHKDRPAQLNRPTAGVFALHSHPNTHMVTWTIEEDHSTGADGTWSPTGLMESVSRYLEQQTHAASLTEINENVRGKDAYIATACTRLVQEGYLQESKGHKNARLFVSIQRYREGDE